MRFTKLTTTFALIGALSLAACGSSGLKYTVADDELRGLSSSSRAVVDQAHAEVMKLEDEMVTADLRSQEKKKTLDSSESRTQAATEAIEQAADVIQQTSSAQEKEVAVQRKTRDEKIEAAKKTYETNLKEINARYKAQQASNQRVLDDAKVSKKLAALEEDLVRAELEENKERQKLNKQQIRAAQAKAEVVRLEELFKMTGVVGAAETERKVKFDKQALEENEKLIELKKRVEKAEEKTEKARKIYEAERAKLSNPSQS